MSHNRVTLEVDLDILAENFRAILRRVAPAEVMAVIKANAYGLGVNEIASVLKKNGASYFAVADVNEAIEIHHHGLPIQILGNLFADEIADAVKYDLICPLNDFETASALNAEAKKQNKTIRGAITVDTGMGRIGMLAKNAFEEIVKINNELENIELFGIYSHFSTSWKLEDDYTNQQIGLLKTLVARLAGVNIAMPHVYIAASGGIANYPEAFDYPFNLVRAGINMYGFCDSWELTPVAQLKARLISVRELPSGSFVGYNKLFRLHKNARIGTIGAGYADGIPLALSNKGYVLVNGVFCPIVGRISMDYTTILLDNVPDVKKGDEVVFFGKQQNSELSIRQWSEAKSTHLHDILCAIGPRVKRIYKYKEL